MSINDQNKNKGSFEQQPTSLAAAMDNATGSQRQATQPAESFSFRQMGGIMRRAMGRNATSAQLVTFTKAINEILEKRVDKSFEITVLPFDLANEQRLAISALTLVTKDTLSPKTGVAYHTYILEGSVEPFPPRMEMINGHNTEIYRVAGDSNDAILHAVISEAIVAKFPNQPVRNADTTVVPRDFPFTNETAVYALVENAVTATTTELEINTPGFQDLNLSFAKNDSNLMVRTSFGSDQLIGADSLPVRTDIVTDFNAVSQPNQQSTQQSADRTSTISRVGAFIDLTWAPVEQAANPWLQVQNNNNQSHVKYAPRLVITSLQSQELLTIPAQLLALLTVFSISENNLWTNAFKPRTGVTGVDFRDIGAIGIETNFEKNPNNIGSRIDTKSANFTTHSLMTLLAASVRQGLAVQLHVPECGADTWFTTVFAEASRGNRGAHDALIKGANVLTNGEFGKRFNSDMPICDNENNRVHMGYYTDANGQRRDIRDIDYVAVLNLVGERNPEIVARFSDTYTNRNIPLNVRLAARKKLYEELLSNVVITGYATPVTISSDFLTALAGAAVACGLNIRPSHAINDTGSMDRAYGSYDNNMIGANATGMFNRGMGQTNMGGQRIGGFSGRY